jgi:hypothetical protein
LTPIRTSRPVFPPITETLSKQAVDRLIRSAGDDPGLYAPETIAYWLRQGWTPERIVRDLLRRSA